MASKVVIFGDSYANSEPVDWSWSNAIKKHYSCINYARAGSSDVYSRIQLFNYLQSKEYSENDIILFFATSLWRMNLLNVFKNIPMQSTYMTHAANQLGKFVKAKNEETDSSDDMQKIKSDPDFFNKYHEYLQNDTENLYKQRLLHAKMLKDLPNFVVYYDTFFKTHEFVFDTHIEHVDKIIENTQIFEDNMLQDDQTFVYVKGTLSYKCGQHPEHRMSVQDKIHNHLNKKQNEIFLHQILQSIESRRNKFNEEILWQTEK